MKISVALCTYNGGKFLGEQLSSIFSQTLPVDEVIICDDCSTDNTVEILLKEFDNINKVGFALDIDNIPDFYILKDKVLRWEKKFWQKKYSNKMDAYRADIDTTFAIYKPRYPQLFKTMTFYEGIRIGGDFTAEHGGWYIDHNQLTDEEEFFKNTASNSSSWKPEKNKELSGRFKDLYL